LAFVMPISSRTTWKMRLLEAACLFCCTLFACGSLRATPVPKKIQEATRLNNLGVAYLNQQLTEKGLVFFRQSVAADDALAIPHLNAGIALLILERVDEARVELELASHLDPNNPRIWYNLGLLERGQNQSDAAVEAFEHVLRIDPTSADARYFLGSLYTDRKEFPSAIQEFRTALRSVPLHASAEFGLARALQRSGEITEARVHFERFDQITREKLASPLAQTYGDQGVYSMAEEIRVASPAPRSALHVSFTVNDLSDHPVPVPIAREGLGAVGGGMCLLDEDGHGQADLIVLNEGRQAVSYHRHRPDGGFDDDSAKDRGLAQTGHAIACAVGDFDNDGHPDVAIALNDRVLLYRNRGDASFTDVTAEVGIKQLNHPAGLTFVDFDHDGDVDLLISGTPGDGPSPRGANVLWRNNGNKTFTEWTEPTGLEGGASSGTAVLSDLNNDRAVDIAVASGADGVMLYMNSREGKFVAVPLYAKQKFAPAVGIAVLDFNKDGWMDLAVTHAAAPGVTLWKNIDGKRFQRVALPLPGVLRAWGITPVDIDNDGWIDLAMVAETAHGTEVRVLRNLGPAGFEDVTDKVKLNKIAVSGGRSILAADVDHDGAADLIVSTNADSPIVLRNVGSNKNHSLQIVLHGLADNKTAIGAKVEVFAGGLWQKWEIAGASGYLSQGANSVLVGLGDATQPDIVRVLWPTGVPQDEVLTSAQRTLDVTELDRRGSSCPVLFAWNGTKYEFVTDTIGAAVVGHWISPHARNTPDPDEWIKVDGSQLKSNHGYLSLRLGEPMEEVNYLDQVRLVAVDHPAGSEVFPNERFKNDPPFSEEKTILTRTAHPAAAAWDDQGTEISALLRDRDHKYVRDFTNSPYAGFANLHHLTLDLGNWSPGKPLRLLMSGFIEYFSATSLYSAWQAGIAPVSPYVEAQLPDGSWKGIVNDMGFPAGLPRTIVTDLTGVMPLGARRIRITTNLQIYWDQILISNEKDAPDLVIQTEIPLASASLAFRGYPKQVDGKTPGDLTYYYDQASTTGPFVRQSGQYTHYGDVLPLLTSIDNQFAIFGSGEDIDLEFSDSRLPNLPTGWKRDYFFYANGYVKDMDYYEAMPFTVGAMPFHGMSGYPYPKAEHFPETQDSLQYQLKWNDRFDSGATQTSHEFKYLPRTVKPQLPNAYRLRN
jgi:hypothetical protein